MTRQDARRHILSEALPSFEPTTLLRVSVSFLGPSYAHPLRPAGLVFVPTDDSFLSVHSQCDDHPLLFPDGRMVLLYPRRGPWASRCAHLFPPTR